MSRYRGVPYKVVGKCILLRATVTCDIVWTGTCHLIPVNSCTSLIEEWQGEISLPQPFNSEPIISLSLRLICVTVKGSRLHYTLLSQFSDSDSGSGWRSGGESAGLHGRRRRHKRMTSLPNEDVTISETSTDIMEGTGIFQLCLFALGGNRILTYGTSVDYKWSFRPSLGDW